MPSPINLQQFLLKTTAPRAVVEDIEVLEPGWTAARLDLHASWINARLAKRYAVPFAEPVPEPFVLWLVALVTRDVWLRRGRDPLDEGSAAYQSDADAAKQEIFEAANSETGLFDLPLRANSTASGIGRGGTMAYSEASPYVAHDAQREAGRQEDSNRGGTYV